jgi:hypothetical protein
MAIYGDKEITISNQRGLIYGDLEITISNQEKIPWINNPYIKSLYILGTEKVDTSFINGKGLEVTVTDIYENNTTSTVAPAETLDVVLTKHLEFSVETKDEGNSWATVDTYIVPATGTYRFTGTIVMRNTAYGMSNMAINDEAVGVYLIMSRGGSLTTVHQVVTAAYSATELIHNKTFTVDSGYYHFIKDDQVYVTISAHVNVTNNGSSDDVSIGLTTASKFVNVWNNANLHPGRNAPMDLENWLPDITQLDFLAAIRDIFNLRFWMDKMRRTIYIEPWDTFVSDEIIEITNLIDHEDMPVEMISTSYNKDITMKFKDDTSDKAYVEYLKTAVSPGQKVIELDSVFCKAGPGVIENAFSNIITGYNDVLREFTTFVPRIYNTIQLYPFPFYDRPVGFNTRIVSWNGLTSGFSWNYDGETKTTYPKIAPLDFNYIYSTYWQKHFHYVDRGKLFTIRIKMDAIFLSQFLTVINNAEAEGFRPIYKATIKGVDLYFILQKITADSQRCECEFILKV